jgi:hypothetical protein
MLRYVVGSIVMLVFRCVSGTVRLPDTSVNAVTGVNFNLPDFSETLEDVPGVFTLNANSK